MAIVKGILKFEVTEDQYHKERVLATVGKMKAGLHSKHDAEIYEGIKELGMTHDGTNVQMTTTDEKYPKITNIFAIDGEVDDGSTLSSEMTKEDWYEKERRERELDAKLRCYYPLAQMGGDPNTPYVAVAHGMIIFNSVYGTEKEKETIRNKAIIVSNPTEIQKRVKNLSEEAKRTLNE